MASSVKERFEFRREFFRLFDAKAEGVLHYCNNSGAWRIKAVPRLPVLGDAIGRRYTPFVLYFDCPDFYFEEEAEQSLPLYHRKNLLTTPFTFPCVFTQRVMTQTVNNGGSFKTMPTITIVALGSGTVSSQEEAQDSGINIIWGGGKKLTLEYQMTEDEVVIVDSGNLTVTSSLAGDIIHCITDTSEFPELEPGENAITVSNNSGKELVAHITWHNREAGL